jgi:hypothetical protein
MESDAPQHVTVKEGLLRCVRLPDGRFHLVRGGPLVDLFYGGNHVLLSEALASVLRAACAHCAEFRPTELVQVAKGEKLGTYYELLPRDEFTPDDIGLDASDLHVWHFRGGHVFVSPKVAEILRERGFQNLCFSPAFRNFAGGA